MKYLLVLFLASTAHAAVDCNKPESFPLITKAELESVVAKNEAATIVDVNGKDSYTKTHVPGAIDYSAHKNDFAKILPAKKDTLIVAYCGGPMCGAWHAAAKVACAKGYTNIRHFKDGIKGWTAKN